MEKELIRVRNLIQAFEQCNPGGYIHLTFYGSTFHTGEIRFRKARTGSDEGILYFDDRMRLIKKMRNLVPYQNWTLDELEHEQKETENE